jgi:hypothetical protein
VYSLKDVLEANGIHRSLSEISVMTLSVDIMADIIKVGEPKLKTTLFAINKTAKALGLDYQSLKVAPADELKLKTPFIAHFKNEHFVAVQKIAGGKIYYTDLDYPRIVDEQAFLNNVDGFVFARAPPAGQIEKGDRAMALSPFSESFSSVPYKVVPAALQAFVWGDKWRDLSKTLPGLVKNGGLGFDLVLQIASLAMSALGIDPMSMIGGQLGITGSDGVLSQVFGSDLGGMFGGGGKSIFDAGFTFSDFSFNFVTAVFQQSLGALFGTLEQICVMKKACSPGSAFILGTALQTAISMGVMSLNPATPGSSIVGGVAVPGSAIPSSVADGFGSLNWSAFPAAFGRGLIEGGITGALEYEVNKLFDCSSQASATGTCQSDSMFSKIASYITGAIISRAVSAGLNYAIGAAGLGGTPGIGVPASGSVDLDNSSKAHKVQQFIPDSTSSTGWSEQFVDGSTKPVSPAGPGQDFLAATKQITPTDNLQNFFDQLNNISEEGAQSIMWTVLCRSWAQLFIVKGCLPMPLPLPTFLLRLPGSI